MAKRSGLTILELLVALISVAIVLAVLFHALEAWFADGHTKSPQVSCLSNIKQIGFGAMQYAQDFDERYPNSGFVAVRIKGKPSAALASTAEKPENAWYQTLIPYIKNETALYCPSDEAKHRTMRLRSINSNEYAASYAMNEWAAFGLKTEEVKHPPEFILFAERNNEALAGDGSYLFTPWDWLIERDLALTRHSQGSDVAMADGHSKW